MTGSSKKPAEEPPEETAAVNTDAAPLPAESKAPEQTKIAALEEELSRVRDQWLRAMAETENIRKRAERDQAEISKYAISAFARDMVQVLENLKRASESIHQAEGGDGIKTIGEGVDLTLSELLNIFEKYGIRRIDPLNKKFDHNFHQAVAQVERDDVPPGTVIQLVQAGYVIHDRLLRPAMVVVSKQGEPPKAVDTTA